MAIGIGQESSVMASVSSDVDLYRYKYRETEQQIDQSNVNISFVSPVFSVYEKNRFTLLRNSTIVEMTPRWRYRPDYLSYDKYNTTAWWQLLLWINDIKSIEYFTKETVIVPTIDILSSIEKDAYFTGGYIDINEDEKHKKTLYTLFLNPINNLEEIKLSPPTPGGTSTLNELIQPNNEIQEESKFVREIFNLTIPMLRLRHVDLKHVPIEASIRVLANCRPNLIYNKHYKLIEDDNKALRRITWDPEIIDNAGLLFKLRENDSLEVQYATSE